MIQQINSNGHDIVVALAGLILLMFIGGEMGKRAEEPTEIVSEQGNLPRYWQGDVRRKKSSR